MASKHRTESPALSSALADDLQRNGSRYGFFQAMRLLRQSVSNEQVLRDLVRVRPALSLAFPDSDIGHIQRDGQGRYRIEANFFGLYGVTSPLPTFYTEDLIQESMQGHSAMRDFLDIVHATLYPLLYQAWEKYRVWLTIEEQGDRHRLQQLYALVGMADLSAWHGTARTLLPFAGSLSAFPRSASGLEGLLQGMLRNVPVQVAPCAVRAVSIPPQARTLLGRHACRLGDDTVLGEEVMDCAGNADIVIGPLLADDFHALLPGAEQHQRIQRVVRWYLSAPVRCEFHLSIEPRERRCASLGKGWQRLGLNTWLGKDDVAPLPARPVRFPLPLTLETMPS